VARSGNAPDPAAPLRRGRGGCRAPARGRALKCEGLLLKAQLASARGDHDTARAALRQAVREFPDDSEAWQDWCRFAFDRCGEKEAELALRELLRRWPEDASAHHNLAPST